MAKIDIEQLANEYGLHVEKSDAGEFKDATVMVFLDSDYTGGPAFMWATYAPNRGNISVWSDLYCDKCHPNRPTFHRHESWYNDDYNLEALRKVIEKTLEQYNTVKKVIPIKL